MENKKEEVDVSKGLMKQTKAQLVDIILRKDDRERELLSKLKSTDNSHREQICSYKNDIAKHESTIDKLNAELDNKNKHIKKLMFDKNSIEADYQNQCDETATIVQEYKNKIKLYVLALYILCAITILCLLLRYIGI